MTYGLCRNKQQKETHDALVEKALRKLKRFSGEAGILSSNELDAIEESLGELDLIRFQLFVTPLRAALARNYERRRSEGSKERDRHENKTSTIQT